MDPPTCDASTNEDGMQSVETSIIAGIANIIEHEQRTAEKALNSGPEECLQFKQLFAESGKRQRSPAVDEDEPEPTLEQETPSAATTTCLVPNNTPATETVVNVSSDEESPLIVDKENDDCWPGC